VKALNEVKASIPPDSSSLAEQVQTNTDEIGNLSISVTDIQTNGIQIGGTPGAKHGYFSVLATRSTIDYHAYEDWGILNTTDTGLGYCSFDSKVTMNNSLNQNHLVGYQSRMIYNGAGNLTNYLHGYDTAIVHNGTGTITLSSQVYLKDVAGTGPITNNYGIYIENITRGTTKNYAIYSEGGQNYFGGSITTPLILSQATAFGMNYGVDTSGKNISIGFGSNGQTNYGRIDFYNGKNGRVASINETGVTVDENLTVSKNLTLASTSTLTTPLILSQATSFGMNYGVDTSGKKINIGYGSGGTTNYGEIDFYDGKTNLVAKITQTGLTLSNLLNLNKYTWATLPTATEGAVAYCTDGRKTGEGAGSGTGVAVYYSGGSWRTFYNDATVTH
jgi:hypothetical protein